MQTGSSGRNLFEIYLLIGQWIQECGAKESREVTAIMVFSHLLIMCYIPIYATANVALRAPSRFVIR